MRCMYLHSFLFLDLIPKRPISQFGVSVVAVFFIYLFLYCGGRGGWAGGYGTNEGFTIYSRRYGPSNYENFENFPSWEPTYEIRFS